MMLRRTLVVTFALILALTSQSMAVARGASAATGQMVLCTGSGPQAVYVDAAGNPTSAPHICPDSALNVIWADPFPDLAAPTRPALFHIAGRHDRGRPAVFWRQTPPSRAPPFAV